MLTKQEADRIDIYLETHSDVSDNSIAYMKGWLKALKDDVRMVVTAASRATKAVDYILGRTVTE